MRALINGQVPIQDIFDSEFCNVSYRKAHHIVFLVWKKFCCYDDYRKPTTFALNLLRKHPNSNFVFDARNGFEDEKEDVAWGFSKLLPAMAQTTCKHVVFIMNEISNIEDEMSMWEKEFRKYFKVKQVASFEEAVVYLSRQKK